jgi:hypothetical protein
MMTVDCGSNDGGAIGTLFEGALVTDATGLLLGFGCTIVVGAGGSGACELAEMTAADCNRNV